MTPALDGLKLGFENALEKMAMAPGLIFGAMAHEGNRAALGEGLEESKRKLLAVILDRAVGTIKKRAFEQLSAVATRKLSPSDAAGLVLSEQAFTRAEARHPNVVTVFG
jgi:hypothetical protein